MERQTLDKTTRIVAEYFAGPLPAELEGKIRRWLTGGKHQAEKNLALRREWNKRVDYDLAPGSYAFDSLDKITRRLGFPEAVQQKSQKKTLAPRKRILFRVAAVTIPLLLLGGVGLWLARTARPEPVQVTVAADAGVQVQHTLPDGSQVWINPDSRISYADPFGGNREVQLTGEAFFDVTKDENSPFTVSSDALQVTVHGTQFMVTVPEDKDRATVTLHSGSVEVAAGESQTVLNPGEQLQYYAETNEIRVEEVELEDWTKPSLDFYAASLEEIFHSLERNFDVVIRPSAPVPIAPQYTIRFSAQQKIGDVVRILSNLTKIFEYSINENEINITFVD